MAADDRQSDRCILVEGTSLRPDDASRWSLPHTAVAYVVGFVASGIMASVAIASGASRDSAATLAAGSGGLWIGFIGGPILASRLRGTGRMVDEFGLRFRWIDVPVGLVSGVAFQFVVVPVVSWPLQRLLGGDVGESARDLLGEPGPGRWLIIAIVVLGAPVAEELFFRGLLLRSLARRFSDRVAVVVSAVLFAATHFKVLPFPGLLVVGLLFAYLTKRSGRLGPAIVAHAAFNASTVVALSV